MIDMTDNTKITSLKDYFEDKTGLKANKKVKNFFEPKKSEDENSFNESFVFLNIADFSYQELDNLVGFYFSEVWGKKESFQLKTGDPNRLKIVFKNEKKESAIVTRYANINLKNKTYSLSVEFFKDESKLKNFMGQMKILN